MKIGAKVNFFNFRMRERRKELDMSQAQLAEICETNVSSISEIESLKAFSIKSIDRVRNLLFIIADRLETDFEYLFPDDYLLAIQSGYGFEKNIYLLKDTSMETLKPGEIEQQLFLPSPEEEIDLKILAQDMENILDGLPIREQRIIRDRYGFDAEPLTFEDTARKHGVTRERIRQIESRALSRLRHPNIRKKLRDYISS